MKLYDSHLSPYSTRCRMQVYAKGLDIDIIAVPEKVSYDELKKISIIGKIPTLEDGPEIVPESDIIAEYLEDIFPEISLLPKGSRSLARMRLLSRIADLYVMTPLENVFPYMESPNENWDTLNEALVPLYEGLDFLESFIDDGGGYAVGSKLTLADCTLVPVLFYVSSVLKQIKDVKQLTEWEKVNQYWQQIKQEENASKILAEMKLALQHYLKEKSGS